MTQRPEYSDGAPCWADLSTPDLAGAQRFYGELLGWSFEAPRPELAHYTNCHIGGLRVAGMMPMMPMPPGQAEPSSWSVHIKTSDLDAAAQRALEAGGKLLCPRHEVADLGSMWIGLDPTGAVFELWQPKRHLGAELVDEPGAVCWHELYTRDGAAADRFYKAVFDYEQRHIGTCPDIDYTLYCRDGRPVCGRAQMNAAWGELPPHWLTYFVVEDLEAALKKVRALDGRLLFGPIDAPHGANAAVADPYGAAFAIIQRTSLTA